MKNSRHFSLKFTLFSWSRVVSSWVSWSYPSRHHSLYQDDETAKVHTLAHTHAGPGHTKYIPRLLHAPANMQFLSLIRTRSTLSAGIVLVHSLIHSRIFHWYILRTRRFPDFHSRLEKGLENKSGLTLLESPPSPGLGDSWATQLLTEARDETALIIVVTTRGLLGKRIYE